MDLIFKIIKLLIDGGFIPLMDKLTNLLNSVVSLVTKVHDEDIKKKKIQDNENTNTKIKDVCDNGNIEDLLNLTQKIGENK